MKQLILSIDVGGTHSRLQGQICENGQVITTSALYKCIIDSRNSLRKFIQESTSDFTDLSPEKCVIGFAGAVIGRRKVAMTNWQDRPEITIDDLKKWGLPADTFMVNDMELAAYGVLAMKDTGDPASQDCKILYMPEKPTSEYPLNMLVIAPGTGFGTGSIIEILSPSGARIHQVISSEVQHIQIPALDETHARMIQIIFAKKENRYYLNYEDFVSGYGLEDSYNALLRLNGRKPHDRTAAEIAAEAIGGSNETAVQALNYFYRITGRLIQAMCLVIQPYGGIFLCGTSTIRNADFIFQSDLLAEVHKSMVRKELLEQFPLYIVSRENINIEGGLWAGRKQVV
jgi:Glucokinase